MSASRAAMFVVLALFYAHTASSASLPHQFESKLNDEVFIPKKRPFCNAFTGCGRKRSITIPGMPMQEYFRQKQFSDDDGSSFDSENTIEDVSRQILSEAKLWEAIQEAASEISRRKQRENYN